MKFGHDFSQTLKKGDFPQEWIDSAISYKELKKCIKKVQQEIQGLGLDDKTLNDIWKASDGEEAMSEDERNKATPKYIVAVDPRTGVPRDAWLTDDTRRSLMQLVIPEKKATTSDQADPTLELPVLRTGSPVVKGSQETIPFGPSDAPTSNDNQEDDEGLERNPSVTLEEVELPLITNNEFYRVLRQELSRLDDLQLTQQRNVEAEISKLGRELASMVEAGSKKSKNDTTAWRNIFRIYVESEIFFSSREREHGTRGAEKASEQLRVFRSSIEAEGVLSKVTKESRGAFDRFLQINSSLLQYLRFQELNQTALAKILKKFDKRTALHAQAILPPRLAEEPFIAQSIARFASFKISEDLLAIIPQLNDYLCPVCFSVTFKPIRLKCSHVFCIRCLIVMQRARQERCPLCRGANVMEASSENLDVELMDFLQTNFPHEVKVKQKENERAAGVDRYGEDFDKAKCAVM